MCLLLYIVERFPIYSYYDRTRMKSLQQSSIIGIRKLLGDRIWSHNLEELLQIHRALVNDMTGYTASLFARQKRVTVIYSIV